MINESLKYNPQDPVAPGGTLSEAIDYLKISPADLAQITRTTASYVEGVLDGTAAITTDFAEGLTKIMKVPADFWLRYDTDYWRLKALEEKRAKKLTD